MIEFEPRTSIEQVEETGSFAPKFDENGLIPVVTTDFESGSPYAGYMNRDALRQTIQLGEAVYFSRSHKNIMAQREK